MGELNCPSYNEAEFITGPEIQLYLIKKFITINKNFNKNIQARNSSKINRDKATVTEVDQEVGRECGSGEVVDATSAVRDVAEDEAVSGGREGLEDVGDDEGIHEESLGELKGDALCTGGADSPNALVDFKVIVGRQDGDGGIQSRIV